MKTQTQQDADPAASDATPEGGAPLNSVADARGADRLAFIESLIENPEPIEEADEGPAPDNTEQNDSETPPAAPAEPDTEEESSEADDDTTPDVDVESEEPEEDSIPGLKPEIQKSIDKRIGKEVAKRKAAESRIAELEAKLQAQAPAQQQPPSQIDAVTTEDELETVIAQARQARNYARDAVERLADEPEAVIAELREIGIKFPEDAELGKVRARLRGIRSAAEAVLDREPAARKSLAMRSGYRDQVAKDFSWHRDQTSEEWATYRNVLTHPAVRTRPDADFVAAIIVEGLQSYKARTAKKAVAKKVVAKRPATQPGRPATTKVAPREAPDEAARQAWQRDPSDRDARANVLAQMLTTG